jgi:hypothetical protein
VPTLLAEVGAEGGTVRQFPRRHGISESLLHNWGFAHNAAAVAMGALEEVEFTAVGAAEGQTRRRPFLRAPPDWEPLPVTNKSSCIEITLPDGTRINVDATINEKALLRMTDCHKCADH